MSVEHVDFGKEAREAGRKLSRLLGIAAEFETDLQANPAKYYGRAVDEIVRMRRVIDAAREALRPDPLAGYDGSALQQYVAHETIVVEASEWRRLKAMAAVIKAERP